MSNKVKRFVTFIAMMSVFISISYLNIEVYRFIMMNAGAFFVGRAIGDWASTQWPDKVDSPR